MVVRIVEIQLFPPADKCLVFVDDVSLCSTGVYPNVNNCRFWFLKKHVKTWLFGDKFKALLQIPENHATTWQDICRAVSDAANLGVQHSLNPRDVFVSDRGMLMVLTSSGKHVDYFLDVVIPDLHRILKIDVDSVRDATVRYLEAANKKLLKQNAGLVRKLADEQCKNKSNHRAAEFYKRAEHNSWCLAGLKNKFEAEAKLYKEHLIETTLKLDKAEHQNESHEYTIRRLLNDVGRKDAVCEMNSKLLKLINSISTCCMRIQDHHDGGDESFREKQTTATTAPDIDPFKCNVGGEVKVEHVPSKTHRKHLYVISQGNLLVVVQRSRPVSLHKYNNMILYKTLRANINFVHALKHVLNKHNVSYKTKTATKLEFGSENEVMQACVKHVIPLCNILTEK